MKITAKCDSGGHVLDTSVYWHKRTDTHTHTHGGISACILRSESVNMK